MTCRCSIGVVRGLADMDSILFVVVCSGRTQAARILYQTKTGDGG